MRRREKVSLRIRRMRTSGYWPRPVSKADKALLLFYHWEHRDVQCTLRIDAGTKQTLMMAEQLLQLYRSRQPVSLAAWLGDPLSSEAARYCLLSMRDASRDGWSHGQTYFNQRLALMIVRYWAGRGADMEYCNLAATVGNMRDRAQLDLSYGQLLLARKLTSAWEHLDAGFSAAANLLEPEDYFIVMNRHERLRLLVLSSQAMCATDLKGLLNEADVIRQLRGNPAHYRTCSSQHKDTLD